MVEGVLGVEWFASGWEVGKVEWLLGVGWLRKVERSLGVEWFAGGWEVGQRAQLRMHLLQHIDTSKKIDTIIITSQFQSK